MGAGKPTVFFHIDRSVSEDLFERSVPLYSDKSTMKWKAKSLTAYLGFAVLLQVFHHLDSRFLNYGHVLTGLRSVGNVENRNCSAG